MKAAELVEDIRTYCRTNADKQVAEKYARYFTEGYDAYGLSQPVFEAKVRSLIDTGQLTMKLVLAAAKPLIQSGKYEETNFPIALLSKFTDQFDRATLTHIEGWFQVGIVNWAHCDVLCSCLMTPLFERQIIQFTDLAPWRTAENTYQRRAVPVAMLPLLKTEKNFRPLFAFIDPLMPDPEKKVQQGLGWFLREAWKIQPEETETFLLKWKNTAPRIIFQYATEKMTAEDKKRFKKEKIRP